MYMHTDGTCIYHNKVHVSTYSKWNDFLLMFLIKLDTGNNNYTVSVCILLFVSSTAESQSSFFVRLIIYHLVLSRYCLMTIEFLRKDLINLLELSHLVLLRIILFLPTEKKSIDEYFFIVLFLFFYYTSQIVYTVI